MSDKVLLSNGTQGYVVDPTAGTPKALAFCATAIELNEGEPTKIDVTTLCETERTREVDGLLGSSATTITINFDPTNAVHQLFLAAKADKRELRFRIGASDGTSAAAWDTSTKKWKVQNDRSHWDFSGEIASLPFSFAVNSAVQPQVSITMTSAVDFTAKT